VVTDDARGRVLVRRGFILEYLTLSWNVVGIVVLTIAAVGARYAVREVREIFER
jgi:hypothetical protein